MMRAQSVGNVMLAVERNVKIRIRVEEKEVLVLDPTEAYVLNQLLEAEMRVEDVDWSKVA
jgi:hypothetical protein